MYNDNFRPISISQLAICTKNIIVEKLKTRQKYGNIMNFTCQMLQYIKPNLLFLAVCLFVILLLLKISFRMPYRSSKKSHHSQSNRVLIFSGEIITNKTYNCTCKCACNRSDGVNQSNSTTFFTVPFFVIFPTSYIIYEKSKT